MFDAQLDVSQLAIWSIQTPSLYHVQAQVVVKEQVVDDDVALTGFRTMTWSGHTGFALNNKSFDFRGFSNHHSLTGQ
jgi:beta-galactosidase